MTDIRVNTNTADAQTSPAIARDADGNFVVAWQSNLQDGSGLGVYAQRFNAAGEAQGDEFQVNTYATNHQKVPAVAMDGDGNFVVVWDSSGQDGSGSGVYGQRYDADGVPQGTEFRVNTTTSSAQQAATVAMDADGDFVVTWSSHGQDGGGYGVFAQRYNASGMAQGSEFRVNTYTTSHQSTSEVAMDADGDFIVVWVSASQDGTGNGVYAQRYNAAGVAQGNEFRVNTSTVGNEQSANVAMDADGDIVVVWQASNQDGDLNGIYAQRYNAAGEAQGSEFRVNTYTTGNQERPAVAMEADGDFIVTWESDQDGSGDGIYAQRYNAAGVAQGDEFLVNAYTDTHQTLPAVVLRDNGDATIVWASSGQDGSSTGVVMANPAEPIAVEVVAPVAITDIRVNTYTASTQNAPAMAADADGNFVVVWTSSLQDGSGTGVYAQRYDAAGVAMGAEFRVNTYTNSSQGSAAVAMDADGDFVVTWDSYGQDGSGTGIYGQRFDADGVAQGSEFRVNTYTTSSQSLSSVAMDEDGDFVVTWGSNGQDGSSYGVFAQRYNASGEAQGSEFQVNTYTTSIQGLADAAMDANGNFVITWSSNGQDGDGNGIYAQRYNAAGVAQGSEFQVSTFTTNTQTSSDVAMDAEGNFVVTWQSNTQDGDSSGIYAQRYNAAGEAQGGEFRVNASTIGSQDSPAITMDADGAFVIAWSGTDSDTHGVFAQRYTADGVAVGGEFRLNSYMASTQNTVTVALQADGDILAAWHSSTQDMTDGLSNAGVFMSVGAEPQAATINRLDGNTSTLTAQPVRPLNTDMTAQVTSGSMTVSNWNGATLTINRVADDAPAGGPTDLYGFLDRGLFEVETDGVGFNGVEAGSIADAVANQVDTTGLLVSVADGLPFARYYYRPATGTLTIEFGQAASGDASITGAPTQGLVENVIQHIAYGNPTLASDAVIRFALDDTTHVATADVMVLSGAIPPIIVERPEDMAGDPSMGLSLREALALGVAQAGGDTIDLGGVADATILTLAGSTAVLAAGDIIALATSAVTIAGEEGGSLTLGGDAAVDVTDGGTLTLSAALIGAFDLAKTGDGTLVLADAGNETAWTGGLTVAGGVLSVASDDALAGGTVTLAGGTTLAITAATMIDNAIALTGDATLQVDAEAALSGALVGDAALTKTGAGTLILSGLASHSGTTTIGAGLLQVDGVLENTDQVIVASGATLGGTGTIGTTGMSGAVLVQAGGTIGAGASPGTLDLENGLTIEADGTLFAEIEGTTPGTQYDVVRVTGSVVLDGANLSVAVSGFAPAPGSSFVLIDNDGMDSIVGEVEVGGAALAEGATLLIGVQTFELSYQAGDGNDLGLTVVNSAPGITSGGVASVAENTSVAYQATATDPDETALTWSLSGADADLFSIDTVTGLVSFIDAPDFEAPGDADADNIYEITVTAFDGELTQDQALAITVTNAAETIIGTDAAESIVTGEGNDQIDGRGGNDTLDGGDGNDTYFVDAVGDIVIEAAGGGNDRVIASVTHTLRAEVERLSLAGTTALNGAGNALANQLDGNAGANQLSGFEGNDTLYGGDGNDTLLGSADNDWLDGGAGADFMVGGPGDDTLKGGAGADRLIGGDGIDGVSYFGSALGVLVNLQTQSASGGDAAGDTISGFEHVGGGNGDDQLIGDALANTLSGGLGNDTLDGGAGNDMLRGGAGTDRLAGGVGNDSYVVDDLSDIVVEESGGGHDRIVASISYTLGAEVERLSLAGTADVSGMGNALANRLDGNAGANSLAGSEGNDSLYGGVGNDTLDGGADNDILDGGAGADSMAGGEGNDSYVVDDLSDIVVESTGGGSDRVVASISHMLGDEIERLSLAGTADLNGTGNALANRLDGNAGANDLAGSAGNDSLYGGMGNDTLDGGADNDILDGGAGADSLAGGQGNDSYVVDDLGDIVVEATGGGYDRVVASISHTLGDEIERLSLAGTADLNGTGNALANQLDGNAGANDLAGSEGNDSLYGGVGNDTLDGGADDDILDGGAGVDSLMGGEGADVFRFRNVLDASGDSLADVNVTQGDRIDLRSIDANLLRANNQAFTWIDGASFDGVAGQLRFDSGILEGDVDGDGAGDFQLSLDGVASLTADNIWL